LEKAGVNTFFRADNCEPEIITIGSTDVNSGFKFELELSSRGAAIRRATLSEFDNRDYKDPQPLDILQPVSSAGGEILSLANRQIVFANQNLQLPLDKLHWQSLGAEMLDDGSQKASFKAVLKDGSNDKAVINLLKTYTVLPNSNMLECDLSLENASAFEQKVQLNFGGPVGIEREALRSDMRKVVAGFRDSNGKVVSMARAVNKLAKAKDISDRRLEKNGTDFLWAATVNKYFAAILVPIHSENEAGIGVGQKTGEIYGGGDDQTIGLSVRMSQVALAPAGLEGDSRSCRFQLYLGPKDKRLFDKSEYYTELGFVHTISFMACCCPTAVIHPMAFGILAIMEWMYGFIGNYGVVIIILVLLVRVILHPLTKKSQVSMSNMSKLAPQVEQLKKKYANNKAEMNKQVMELYRQQGASPVLGMLPMFVQMPLWIALYSAIYASIALRGAPFLPVWITDLSAPDALFRFSEVTLPIFGKLDSFNLLPIMMGVAFFLQQKLMPSQQAAAQSNPQMAQQQKMMMFMMPILFPLMLYKAPSGLNLYIMTSVFGGVFEQYIIRKHIREKDQVESVGLVSVTSKTGGKVKKKKPKPFFKT